jgi:hypothetical protein
MLVIRRAQAEAFQADADRRFLDFTVSQLRRRYPARAADDATLHAEAAAGLVAARGHGLDDPAAASRFIDARFRFGAHFEQAPKVRTLLGDAKRPAIERIDAAVAAFLEVA